VSEPRAPGTDPLSVGPDGEPWETQPKWRRDFPIDWPRDEYVARRDFTRFLVLVSGGFVVGQTWILLQNFFRQRAGELPIRRVVGVGDLPVGGWRVFAYPGPGDHAIVVRLGERRFVAYDQACTHLLCPVIAQPERGRLHCPCHEGAFDIETGRPTAGPPERPLPRIRLEIRGDVVYATGIERSV
jgi:nitrite reductase/ring-hydroxylating ferredoxin subunit